MARAVRRVFYFKRFAFFIIALCLFFSTALVLFSLEGQALLSYKKSEYYILTALSPYTLYSEAEAERNNQIFSRNPSIIFEYKDSFFVCFEVHNSYNLALKALKELKLEGRLLSILYVATVPFSVTLDLDALSEFKRQYSFSGDSAVRASNALSLLERKQLSNELALVYADNIEQDFFKETLRTVVTESVHLKRLYSVNSALRYELASDRAFKEASAKKQLEYLRLVFCVRFFSLMSEILV